MIPSTLRYLIVMLTALSACAGAWGQATLENPGSGRKAFIQGETWRVDEEGDTVAVFLLRELPVYPPLKFKNKKAEEYYWRTVRDVKLTLPYAKLIAATLIETYEYLETLPQK